MEKKAVLVIWIIGIVLIFAAASIIYTKNSNLADKPQISDDQASAKKLNDVESTNTETSNVDVNNQTKELVSANVTTEGATNSSSGENAAKNTGENAAANTAANTLPSKSKATSTPSPTPVKPVKTYPHDFTLKDFDDKNVNLSDYRGKKVILNFWTTWCIYCEKEMPDLIELNESFKKDNDVVILAIDVQEDPDKVFDYVYSNDIPLKVLLDTEGSVAGQYNVSGFPTTYFINRDGSIETAISGMTNKEAIMDVLSKMK